MGIHLLRQLASELDGLHLRREGAAEHPFDEVLDPLLEVSKNADSEAPLRGPCSQNAACATTALYAPGQS